MIIAKPASRTGTNFIATFEDLQSADYAGNPGRRYFPAADSVKGAGALYK